MLAGAFRTKLTSSGITSKQICIQTDCVTDLPAGGRQYQQYLIYSSVKACTFSLSEKRTMGTTEYGRMGMGSH